MFRLLRYFSMISALATVLIMTALVSGHHWNETDKVHKLAEDRNIAQAYSFANAIWAVHGDFIVGAPDLDRQGLLGLTEVWLASRDVV